MSAWRNVKTLNRPEVCRVRRSIGNNCRSKGRSATLLNMSGRITGHAGSNPAALTNFTLGGVEGHAAELAKQRADSPRSVRRHKLVALARPFSRYQARPECDLLPTIGRSDRLPKGQHGITLQSAMGLTSADRAPTLLDGGNPFRTPAANNGKRTVLLRRGDTSPRPQRGSGECRFPCAAQMGRAVTGRGSARGNALYRVPIARRETICV